MALVDQILQHANYAATLTYTLMDKDDPRKGGRFEIDRPLEDVRCVYFLLNEREIEKVGKTDGNKGLDQRMNDYRCGFRPEKPKDTPRRWHRVMTGTLQGKVLKLYFWTCSERVNVVALGEQVEVQVTYKDLETHFTRRAVDEEHPLRLCQGHDEKETEP